MHADPEPIGPKPSPRLVTPFLDRLTREVTRPKGSAPSSSPRWTRCGTVDPSPTPNRPTRHPGGHRFESRSARDPHRIFSSRRTPSRARWGACPSNRLGRGDARDAPLLRKSTSQLRRRDDSRRRRDRRSTSPPSWTKTRERSRRISRPTWRRSRRRGARRMRRRAQRDASFAAAPEAAKTTKTTTTVRTMPSSSRDRLVRGGSPSTNSCRLRGSRRRPRARRRSRTTRRRPDVRPALSDARV